MDSHMTREEFELETRRAGYKTVCTEDGTYLAPAVEAAWQTLQSKQAKPARAAKEDDHGTKR